MSTDRQTLRATVTGLGPQAGLLDIKRALKQLDALPHDELGLKTVRLGIVSSFTTDALLPPMRACGYASDLKIDLYNAPYGQYIQELINLHSGLALHQPDACLLAVRLADVRPDLYTSFNQLAPERVTQLVEDWKAELLNMLRTFRSHSDTPILCTNYELPPYPSLGLADRRSSPSQTRTLQDLNAWLEDEVPGEVPGVTIVDIDAVAARCGRTRWTDPKLKFLARMPVAPECQWDYASEVIRVVRAISGKARKVLALDCDNTLWGGVLGDVGRDGIALGQDYPGSAYVALQKRALELYHRGVVLIIASKNEHDNVMDVFENHPEMVLRPEHIAHFTVNWDPKPGNLRRAAEILNLGIDSFVFLDDSDVECAMMREMEPSVLTVQMPSDAARYEETLARLDCFDQAAISAEDRKRGAMYKQEAARAELRASTTDLKSFYLGLEMEMTIHRDHKAHIPRGSQLTQRTNQFNMTTIRRTEAEIEALMDSADTSVLTLSLKDRLGDNGIVGMAIVRNEGAVHRVETFLMSCRVLGRTVEQSFMAWIGRQARENGAGQLLAEYRPTRKNTPFRGFFGSWGMQLPNPPDADGLEQWQLSLDAAEAALEPSEWMQITIA